jgi:hypothetical protein
MYPFELLAGSAVGGDTATAGKKKKKRRKGAAASTSPPAINVVSSQSFGSWVEIMAVYTSKRIVPSIAPHLTIFHFNPTRRRRPLLLEIGGDK